MRDADAADRTVVAVEAAGGRATSMRGNAAGEADFIAMWDAAGAVFRPVTGFVNNAGTVAPGVGLADMDHERMQRIFWINLLGAFLGARRHPGADRRRRRSTTRRVRPDRRETIETRSPGP